MRFSIDLQYLQFYTVCVFLLSVFICRKRKSELKAKPPAKKKIKKEPGVSCFVCDERFEKNSFRDAHMVANHRPLQAEYGCSSCIEQFASIEEHTSHHEWHSLFNVPHKCPMCGAIFEKLITFQRHVSACVHQTYTLMTTFSKSIFCELCNLEFETQNLYDWHNCFIGQNSPCPKCQRVFTKKTVLMKHMFKCTGPGSVVEMPKKIATTTGKLAKRKQAGTTTSEIIPQNSFKFEPETIIEPADEAYDELDNSYMDTHFGDSDNEFDANDSIMTPIEPIVEPSPQTSVSNVNTPIYSKARKSTTCTSLNVDTNIRSNLNQPLLECRVKLEPIDISNYAIPSTSTNAESSEDRPLTVPPLVISRPTVPPLTIRIKKEVIQPGYGDDFNPDVARNIKQERVDETYELAGTSRDEYSISHKKSKHRQKEKKLYKKPALLAIKIKQERMEREDNDDNNENYYPDYSMSSPDFRGTMVNSSFNSNSLPIITQIHSALEPSAISPLMNVQSSEHQNSLPFVPIRIKSEFQKPLTPPWSLTPAEEVNEQLSRNSNNTTTENSSLSQRQILNENNECDINLSSCNALNQQSGTSLNQQSGNGSATNQETSKSNSVNDFSEISPNEPSANPVNTEQELKRTERVSSSYDILCERHPQSINEKDSNPFQDGVDNHNEIIQDERSSENLSKQQDLTIDEDPNRMQMENEVLPSQNEVSTINNEMHEEQIDNRIVAEIKMHEENNVSIEKNVNDGNNQNTHFASQVSSEPIENVLDSEANLLKPLCDDLDSEVTNEIMSPIDFIEPNTNDDSLNFIDQLVHEVADTMVSQVGDVVESNDNIPFETANDHIENAQLECNVGCSEENHENKANIINESNLEPIDKTKVNDTVLTLFDIDSKINGNTNPPIQTNSTPSANELIQLPVNTHVLNEPDLSKFCSN